jgi:hypothetical protein
MGLTPAAVLYATATQAIKYVVDGSDYLVGVAAKIRNVSGSIINPATEETITAIKDTAGVKKITDALPIGDNRIGRIKLTDDTNLLVIQAGGQAYTLPYAEDQSGTLRRFEVIEDPSEAGKYDLSIVGKVSISKPPTPDGGTPKTVSADTPLEISQAVSPHDTEYVITDAKTFTIQQIVIGCQGDPSADGSSVEIIYYDGTTEHLVERLYVMGASVPFYPDTSTSRDGLAMTGNGTSKKVIVRRIRLSNSNQEIDVVLRGYEI